MAMLGSQEIILIFLAIVLLFGASKLPELAKSMGRSLGEFKRGQIEIEREINTEKSSLFNTGRAEATPTRTKRMASSLGIETTGKTEDQLLAEIERRLDSK